jgi:hypothetical protein
MWKPTISVSFEDNTLSDNRMEFSAGSTSAANGSYEAASMVPRCPWRAPSSEEIQALFSRDGGEDAGRSVRVLRFPSDLLEAFHKLSSLQGITQESMQHITGSKAARAIFADFNRFAASVPEINGRLPADHIQGGFCVKQPDLRTVTVNPQSRRFIGLHVDNWFRLPLGSRAQSPVRICANFGWCDRFLLFLNVAVDDICSTKVVETLDGQRLEWGSKAVDLRGATALGRKFLQTFDDHPITRIRVKPGEAYIAPTENIVHDASTESGNTLDVSCHINAQ